jgi:hypothetical protein
MTAALVGACIAAIMAVGLFAARAQTSAPLVYNPIAIYGVIWTALLAIYSHVGLHPYPLEQRTANLIILAYATFVVGAVIASNTVRIADRRVGVREKSMYDEEKLGRWYKIALLALSGSVFLQFSQVYSLLGQAGGITGVLAGSGQSFRRAYTADRAAQLSNGLGGGGIAVALLGYVLFMGSISLIWAGYYASRGRTGRALLPLLIVLVYSLLTLQRAAFVYPLVIFLSSWLYHRNGMDKTGRDFSPRRRFAIVALILVTAAAVIVPSEIRSVGSTGVDKQGGVVQYLEAGIAGLNAAVRGNLDDPTISDAATGSASPFAASNTAYSGPSPTRGYGRWTFGGLFSIVQRLGAPISLPPTDFTFVFTSSSNYETSNTYTFILYFYYDLGWWGVALFSFLLGFVAIRLHERAATMKLGSIPMACVLLTTCTLLFFSVTPLRDFRYLALAFFGLINCRLVERVPIEREAAVAHEENTRDTRAGPTTRSPVRTKFL